MKKALIIGGAGFVGKHLARCLYEEGYAVSVTKLPFESLTCRLQMYMIWIY